MSESPFVTSVDFEEHLRSDPKLAHGIYSLTRGDIPAEVYSKAEIDAFFEGEDAGKKQVDWARITSKPSSYPPSAHASSHHVGGGDLVNHDSLTGFVVAEHLSLPNTIANVLSDHDKVAHDALGIDADTLDSIDSGGFLQNPATAA